MSHVMVCHPDNGLVYDGFGAVGSILSNCPFIPVGIVMLQVYPHLLHLSVVGQFLEVRFHCVSYCLCPESCTLYLIFFSQLYVAQFFCFVFSHHWGKEPHKFSLIVWFAMYLLVIVLFLSAGSP